MGEKPQWRKYREPASGRGHTHTDARKHGLTASGIVEIENCRHEPPGIAVIHYIHMRRKRIAPVRQITLEAKLLTHRLRRPIGADLKRLPVISQARNDDLADLDCDYGHR